jgi:hypothetical protein
MEKIKKRFTEICDEKNPEKKIGFTRVCDFKFNENGEYHILRPEMEDKKLLENGVFSLKLFTKKYFSPLKVLKNKVLPLKPTNCIVRIEDPIIVTWFNLNDEVHREDGPAHIVYPEVTKGGGHGMLEIWYKNGKIHRENEPAIISEGGYYRYIETGEIASTYSPTKTWYLDGKVHRADGPARIEGEGNGWRRTWFENDKKIKEEVKYIGQEFQVNFF